MAQSVQAYTVAEAAKELGVTPTTIKRWLANKRLSSSGMVAGRIQLVTAKSVEAMKKSQRA